MNASKVEQATESYWDFMANEDTMKALSNASRYAASYAGGRSVEAEDDLYQQGMLYLAVRPDLQAKHPGNIYLHLMRALVRLVRKENAEVVALGSNFFEDTGNMTGLSRSGAMPADIEMGQAWPALTRYGYEGDSFGALHDIDDVAYPRALVLQLLEAMWNGWVVTDEFRPDGDMPRAKPNPKKSGTAIVHQIDIEQAWDKAPTSLEFRMVACLVIGNGYSQEAAGAVLQMDRSTVRTHLERGLEALCFYLNGETR